MSDIPMPPATRRTYSVRDEYAPTFGRQRLTLWSGGFASDFDGTATELPGHNGYMVRLRNGSTIRLECESPRTDENYLRVDQAINDGIRKYGTEEP